MTTHRAVVDALAHAAERGEHVVLATVVRVTGSSYGGVGARMVSRVDGSTVGIVSGGCLESDLAEHALAVHRTGRAKIVTYDTRGDDDAAWGLGLGCNGLIDVLVEPMSPMHAGAFAVLLEQALQGDSASVMASVIAAPADEGAPSIGAHALLTGELSQTTGAWGDGNVLGRVTHDFDTAMTEGRRGLVRDYGPVAVAFEVVLPAVRLVICGSGPDVVPVARFASELGWNVTVVDHRPLDHAHPERFPDARVAECAEPHLLGHSIALTGRTAAVVMSHHFTRDLGYLRALLASDAAYIGLLGPRARADRMMAEISASGEDVTHDERIHSPVGLDVGGDGPDAIALAIVAEVSAVLSGRSGRHLRERRAPLHEDVSDASATPSPN